MENNNEGDRQIPNKMLSLDSFSQWLGIEILESEIGKVKLGMKIRPICLTACKKPMVELCTV